MSAVKPEPECCPACSAQTFESLPPPHPRQSMLSDGRILPYPVDKIRCGECSLVRHRRRLPAEVVRTLYEAGYTLPQLTGAGDHARARHFADAIETALEGRDSFGCILDAACGSGALLRELRKRARGETYTGLDPAIPATEESEDGRFRLLRQFIDDAASGLGPFDMVISVNAIEHSHDPANFLAALRRMMASSGRLFVVCPSATPPNLELLFYDHLWTLNPSAIARFAAGAGLSLHAQKPLSGELLGFSLYDLRPGTACECAMAYPPQEADTAEYLSAWSRLDEDLCAALVAADGPVQIFGAGQMAALLRAYAPRAFAMGRRLVLDRTSEAWPLGEIIAYDPQDHKQGWVTLVAVHPVSQGVVERRIREDGGRPVALPPSIAR